MSQMSIELHIARITVPSRKSSAVADLAVEIHTNLGIITVEDCRILRSRSGRLWFSGPNHPLEPGKFTPTVKFDGELEAAIPQLALTEFRKWLDANANLKSSILAGEGGTK